VIRPGDASGLAEALLGLADNPQRRQEMGMAARAALVARHDRRVAAAKFLRVIERVRRAPRLPVR
jgi:glycosyltransferase involved in cell wall biosynthesis